jgi:uncharacterized protein YkwD
MFWKKVKNYKPNFLIDSDDDGLSDFEEKYIYGTDPFDPDSDHDGIKDAEEIRMGRNPRGDGSLRDLFIPNQNNDYLPQALHPRRLAFHAVSAIAIKLTIIGFAVIFPIEAWLSPDLVAEQAKRIIDLTNNVRAGLHLPPLIESNLLDQGAFMKSQDMLLKQYFDHVSPDKVALADWLNAAHYRYYAAGENLAMGFNNAEEVVNGWKNSRTHYKNMIDPDFTQIGVGITSGIFGKNETTLVTQFFGRPQKSADTSVDHVSQMTSERRDKVRPALKSIDRSRAEVMADKIVAKLPLPAPVLLWPETGEVLSAKNQKLKIYAPETDEIAVYIDGKPTGLKNLPMVSSADKDYYEMSAGLEDGRHTVLIRSKRGKEETVSKSYVLNIDSTPPMVDLNRSNLVVQDRPNEKKMVVSANIFLSADTQTAQLELNGRYIDLVKDEFETGKWTARGIVYYENDRSAANPLVLANVTATDSAGSTAMADIPFDNIEPLKTSIIEQYAFLRDHQPEYIKRLFDITSVYYKLLITILLAAMILNIFIEIRKQHPKAIIASFGLLFLMLVLIAT